MTEVTLKSDEKVTIMSKSDQKAEQPKHKVIIDLEKCMEKSKPPVPNREGSRLRKNSSRNSHRESRTRKSSVRFKVEKSDSTKNLLIDTRSEYSCSSIDLTTYVLHSTFRIRAVQGLTLPIYLLVRFA